MSGASKSGMVVSSAGEIIGWVNKGDDIDMQEGDTLVSHHKTAEKMGLLAEFNAIKADNAPVKEVKEKAAKAPKEPKLDADGNPIARVRRDPIPDTGTFEILKDLPVGETSRGATMQCIVDSKGDLAAALACPAYMHTKRDGSDDREIGAREVLQYLRSRNMITIG